MTIPSTGGRRLPPCSRCSSWPPAPCRSRATPPTRSWAGPFGQNQVLQLPLGLRRVAAGGDQDRDQRGRGRLQCVAPEQGRHVRLRRRRRATSSTTATSRRAASTGSPASAATPPPGSPSGSARTATGSTGAPSAGARRPDRPNGCYDAENITLDELGHVLGLDHHVNYADDSDYGDAVVQTYSRTKPKAFWNAHVYGRCDVATLQQVYDVATSSTLYSTCLDVPTTLAVAANRTWLLPGTSVTFTATLSTAGTGRLSNNPVSGRIVVLQRRTSSGWSDVATMAPGSSAGTYVATVVPRATSDWRALFRKPASRGAPGLVVPGR